MTAEVAFLNVKVNKVSPHETGPKHLFQSDEFFLHRLYLFLNLFHTVFVFVLLFFDSVLALFLIWAAHDVSSSGPTWEPPAVWEKGSGDIMRSRAVRVLWTWRVDNWRWDGRCRESMIGRHKTGEQGKKGKHWSIDQILFMQYFPKASSQYAS